MIGMGGASIEGLPWCRCRLLAQTFFFLSPPCPSGIPASRGGLGLSTFYLGTPLDLCPFSAERAPRVIRRVIPRPTHLTPKIRAQYPCLSL